ncbi:MAG: hypothetical protein QXF06_03530 [Archaeoglobaceae archaeon]
MSLEEAYRVLWNAAKDKNPQKIERYVMNFNGRKMEALSNIIICFPIIRSIPIRSNMQRRVVDNLNLDKEN